MSSSPPLVADVATPEWLHAASRPVPDRVPASSPLGLDAAVPDTEDASPRVAPGTRRLRTYARWLRDAVIGVALIVSAPFAAIATGDFAIPLNLTGVAERVRAVDPLRTLRLPIDPSLSPRVEGQLWHAIATTDAATSFPVQPTAPAGARTWEELSLTDGMFEGVPREGKRLLRSSVLLHAAATGLSDAERQYLRAIAESPIWRDVDALATAASVDVIGARYVLPFRDDASALNMPIVRFSGTKGVAYAGLARAAHHVAVGEPERAEQALRSVLSFGFVLIDNGSSAIEAALGAVIVGVARDGLHTLYTLTGNEAGALMTAARADAGPDGAPRPSTVAAESYRATAADPHVPRAIRLESLRLLSLSQCGDLRSVLFGPSATARQPFDDARRELARYPSERALIDLLEAAPDRPIEGLSPRSTMDELLFAAASVASTVLQNPRVETCTRLVVTNR